MNIRRLTALPLKSAAFTPLSTPHDLATSVYCIRLAPFFILYSNPSTRTATAAASAQVTESYGRNFSSSGTLKYPYSAAAFKTLTAIPSASENTLSSMAVESSYLLTAFIIITAKSYRDTFAFASAGATDSLLKMSSSCRSVSSAANAGRILPPVTEKSIASAVTTAAEDLIFFIIILSNLPHLRTAL